MDDMLEEFDYIIEEAPVDFLGTGSDGKFADKCEREWRDRVTSFREELVRLLEERK